VEVIRTSSRPSSFTSPKRLVPRACALIFSHNDLRATLDRAPLSFQYSLDQFPHIALNYLQVLRMSPPVETFPASQLAQRIQLTPQGRKKKGREVELGDCELLEMVQYSCHLEVHPETLRTAIVKCEPIVRLFRK